MSLPNSPGRGIVWKIQRRLPDFTSNAWIAQLVEARDRTRAAPTFAADGLYFTGADYDAKWDLPSTRRPVVIPFAGEA